VGVAFVFSAGLAAAQAPKSDDGKAKAAAPAAPTAPAAASDTKMEEKKDSAKMKAHTAMGTVKSVSADTLVVAGKAKGKETEWTFGIDDKTKLKKAGKDVTAKDVAAGDRVTVRYMDHGGKMVATSVSASAAKQAAKAKEEPAKK
jgi:hypothetical protein